MKNYEIEKIREELIDSINSAYSKYGRHHVRKQVLTMLEKYGNIEFNRALDDCKDCSGVVSGEIHRSEIERLRKKIN